MRSAPRLLLVAGLVAAPAFALPPAPRAAPPEFGAAEPVASIPTANGIESFRALDGAHVMVALADRQQYLVTLARDCVGLRFAEHIGVSTSDNAIWAGFDALIADGHNCTIRTIHRLPDAAPTRLQ